MLQPCPAQSAQQGDLVIAVLQQPMGGVLGIGIVLHMGQHNGLVLGFGLRGGVKVTDDEVGTQAKPFGIVVARVAGHNKITGLHIAAQCGGNRHGGKNHGTPAHFSHSFRALASSYMAR